MAKDRRAAGRRRQQAQEDAQQRALAGAVRADQPDDPGFELDGQFVERRDSPGYRLGKGLGRDRRHRSRSLADDGTAWSGTGRGVLRTVRRRPPGCARRVSPSGGRHRPLRGAPPASTRRSEDAQPADTVARSDSPSTPAANRLELPPDLLATRCALLDGGAIEDGDELLATEPGDVARPQAARQVDRTSAGPRRRRHVRVAC